MLESVLSREANFTPTDRKKKVGAYALGRVIGEGKFARVRLGVHIIARHKVALKIISKIGALKREMTRKIARREASVLQRLHHPNIVRLYDVMETEGKFYLVMELAEGESLKEILKHRGRLEEGGCRRIMAQLVSAVDHMHQSNVVHRDLKLDNIMVDARGNLKIVDMGLSTVYTDTSPLTTLCGSPAYTAPEVLAGLPYGPSVDIWSLGVNMYVMLSGDFPFNLKPTSHVTALYAASLKGVIAPTYVSSGCKNLLQSLLEKDESKRIRINDIISHHWFLSPNSDQSTITRHSPFSRNHQPTLSRDVIRRVAVLYNENEVAVMAAVRRGVGNPLYACYHVILVARGNDMLNINGKAAGNSDNNSDNGDNRSTSNQSIDNSRNSTEYYNNFISHLPTQKSNKPRKTVLIVSNGSENTTGFLPDIRQPSETVKLRRPRVAHASPASDERTVRSDDRTTNTSRSSRHSDQSVYSDSTIARLGVESDLKGAVTTINFPYRRDNSFVNRYRQNVERVVNTDIDTRRNSSISSDSASDKIRRLSIPLVEILKKVEPIKHIFSKKSDPIHKINQMKNISEKTSQNNRNFSSKNINTIILPTPIRYTPPTSAESDISDNHDNFHGVTKVEIRVNPSSTNNNVSDKKVNVIDVLESKCASCRLRKHNCVCDNGKTGDGPRIYRLNTPSRTERFAVNALSINTPSGADRFTGNALSANKMAARRNVLKGIKLWASDKR